MKQLVLVVDDERFFRKLVMRILAEKYEVYEAINGYDAIEQVRRLHPDLVIMDLAMPECNGLEAIRRLREESPACKIVACTVHSDPQYRVAALESGAQAFLPKRLIFSQITPLLNSMLNSGNRPQSRA